MSRRRWAEKVPTITEMKYAKPRSASSRLIPGNASMMAFTRAMGGTAPRDGLRVIGINPGPVLTDRLITLMRTRALTQFGDAERWTEYMRPLAFGRAAKPEEIAWMAAFLASEKSAYTTGSIITIDGGGSSRRSAL